MISEPLSFCLVGYLCFCQTHFYAPLSDHAWNICKPGRSTMLCIEYCDHGQHSFLIAKDRFADPHYAGRHTADEMNILSVMKALQYAFKVRTVRMAGIYEFGRASLGRAPCRERSSYIQSTSMIGRRIRTEADHLRSG